MRLHHLQAVGLHLWREQGVVGRSPGLQMGDLNARVSHEHACQRVIVMSNVWLYNFLLPGCLPTTHLYAAAAGAPRCCVAAAGPCDCVPNDVHHLPKVTGVRQGLRQLHLQGWATHTIAAAPCGSAQLTHPQLLRLDHEPAGRNIKYRIKRHKFPRMLAAPPGIKTPDSACWGLKLLKARVKHD
jgi:hypothetical protein